MEKIKIVLVGQLGVGKTSILKRFIDDKFYANSYDTLLKKTNIQMERRGKSFFIEYFDTEREEVTGKMTPNFYNGTSAALIVFDVEDRKSFDEVENWKEDIDRNLKMKNPLILLIGSKCDTSSRKVTYKEGQTKAEALGIYYYEVSAKTSQNMSIVLEYIINKLIFKEEPIVLTNNQEVKKINYNCYNITLICFCGIPLSIYFLYILIKKYI